MKKKNEKKKERKIQIGGVVCRDRGEVPRLCLLVGRGLYKRSHFPPFSLPTFSFLIIPIHSFLSSFPFPFHIYIFFLWEGKGGGLGNTHTPFTFFFFKSPFSHTHTHTHVRTHTHIHTHPHTPAHPHTHTHTPAHPHTRTHTYTYTALNFPFFFFPRISSFPFPSPRPLF